MNWNDQSLLILENEFEKVSLQVSTFTNEPWIENFLGIDFYPKIIPSKIYF